jgi:hypothetical protein
MGTLMRFIENSVSIVRIVGMDNNLPEMEKNLEKACVG